MQTRDTDAIPLAPHPVLDHYRTLAKELLSASKTGSDDAIRSWAHDWMERLTRLRAEARTPENTGPRRSARRDDVRVEREVNDILRDVHASRLLESAGARARPALTEAQLVLARLHGFDSWQKFSMHIEAGSRPGSPVSQFERAADAIVSGDIGTLRALLASNTDLVHARSTREHGATLLHYVAANGHEGFRQQTPPNAVAIATLLLDAGADADAQAHMYGTECTTIEMLVSSVHPHNAGVQSALVETLIDHGAAPDGPDGEGSPLLTALRFHYPAAAETLTRRGARIDNVIAAGALGRVDLLEQFVDEQGRLRPGIAMPDVPWPRLPRDPAVHLAWALTWACAFRHDDAALLLLERGVDPGASDSDMSALHYAAAYGRMDVVREITRREVSLETLNSYEGTVLDGVLWFAFNTPARDVDYAGVVRELVDMGARTDCYPEMQAHVDAVLAGRRG